MLFAFVSLVSFISYGQKIKGVITYINNDNKIYADLGAEVNLISCNPCKSVDYIYVIDYSLNISINEGKLRRGELQDSDINNISTLKGMVEKLKNKKLSKRATVDGLGNYSIENIAPGKYVIFFECRHCERYEAKVVEIKNNSFLSEDYKFLCF